MRAVRLTARATLIVTPLAYPSCGDWLCLDDADWAEADPVGEPCSRGSRPSGAASTCCSSMPGWR
jgi:hypothetical protein